MLKNTSEIERPGERFVFVDHGGNVTLLMGGWTCYVANDAWWDPPPAHHNGGTSFSFADGHGEYWQWQDPRTVEFAELMVAMSKLPPGNEDIRRTREAAWGQAPQSPPGERGPHARDR